MIKEERPIIESLVRRDRLVVLAGIVLLLVIAWVYILLGAGMGNSAFEMTSLTLPATESSAEASTSMAMDTGMMMQTAVWTPAYAWLMFVMWWVMMIAMMLPSAAPMILLFASVNRKQRLQGAPFVPTSVFAAGYLVAWGLFSLLAMSAQWGFEHFGLLSVMMASTNGLFGALILIVGGIFQLTPLKHACLQQCRSPMAFVMHHWRGGVVGAWQMGIHHGILCVGCCWALMALLFVGGVMNLTWIVGLAVLVLLEKTVPPGHKLGSITGIILLAWGGWMLVDILVWGT